MPVHNVSAISNRVIANSLGSIQVRGVGCANHFSENRAPLPGGGWEYPMIIGNFTGQGPGCITGTPTTFPAPQDRLRTGNSLFEPKCSVSQSRVFLTVVG